MEIQVIKNAPGHGFTEYFFNAKNLKSGRTHPAGENVTRKSLDNPGFLSQLIQTVFQEHVVQEIISQPGIGPYTRNEERGVTYW